MLNVILLSTITILVLVILTVAGFLFHAHLTQQRLSPRVEKRLERAVVSAVALNLIAMIAVIWSWSWF